MISKFIFTAIAMACSISAEKQSSEPEEVRWIGAECVADMGHCVQSKLSTVGELDEEAYRLCFDTFLNPEN